MKLDKSLVKEIRYLNSNGDRAVKVEFARRMRDAVADLSNPNVMTGFSDIMRKHGRALTALCVAATIQAHADRLNPATIEWAEAVLASFENPERAARLGVYEDGLHPSRIEEYAKSLIKYTTEA